MTCEGCINKHRCASCQHGELYLREVKQRKDDRKPSPWEKRWIKWAKKEGKKSDGETTINALNYILGRLEGISCGRADTIRGALLNTREMLAALIEEDNDEEKRWKEEMISALNVQLQEKNNEL